MGKPIWWKVPELSVEELAQTEINLMKYINQDLMLRYLPKAIQRSIKLLIDTGNYVLDGIILKKTK